MVKERKTWVDALRAIAMLLVIYGHCARGLSGFFIFTSPIKLPLFFAISGYVFSMHQGNQRLFWKNWFVKLIIPWFCLALIPYIPKIVVNPKYGLVYFYNLVSGKEFWFMPCFTIAEAIHFYIRKVAKKEMMVIVLSVMFFILGLVAHRLNILNFAMVNRAFIVQLFFLLGYIFKQHEEKFIRINWPLLIIGVLLYVGLGVYSFFAFPKQSLDVHLNQYYNLPICLLMIFLGVFLLFTIFNKAKIGGKILSYIGQNTLLFFLWHGLAIGILVHLLEFISIELAPIWWSATLKTVWACLICGFCAFIINKYAPWMVGKRKQKLNDE